MKIVYRLYKISEVNLEDEFRRLPFIVSDIIGYIKARYTKESIEKADINVVHISCYENDFIDNINEVKDGFDKFREVGRLAKIFNPNKDIVLIEAYLNKVDYPPTKYYDSKIRANYDVATHELDDKYKDLIDIHNIIPHALKEQGDRLIEQDFMNINAFVQYEYKEAYIFNNSIGRKVKWELFERNDYNEQIDIIVDKQQ